MGTDELHEPRVFTKTHREDFNQDTPKRPYLTFKLGPGELQHLTINVWSNDQGWCDEHLKTDDIYANSHTWFSLGVIKESIVGQEIQTELHEFQRNARATSAMRCHTNHWNLGVSAEEDDCNENHAWLESLAQAQGSVIGVFPRAEHPGWVNSVWKMKVLVYSNTRHDSQSTKPRTRLSHGNEADTSIASPFSSAMRIVDQEEEVHIMSSAIQLVSEDLPNKAANWHDLSKWFYDPYTHMQALANVEEGICIAGRAVETAPEDRPYRSISLNNLERHLSDRYSRAGGMVDLEEAIHVNRQAVEATPEDHPDRAMYLNNLGLSLSDRYTRTGAAADLEEAIRIIRKAVEATPKDSLNWAGWLNNLGNRLGDRYLCTGAMVDLEEAIHVARQAVEATPQGHPDRAMYLNNLGLSLSDRYIRTGAMADLEEAIRITRQAVEAIPEDHPDRAGQLNNLGRHLSNRYSRTGAMADLEEAIRIACHAVEATPEGHPDRAMYLNNLGSHLDNRYRRTGTMADLEESIHVARQAVEAIPEDHPDRATYSSNLGLSLGDRYTRTSAMADLEEAIRISREAIEATPADHPNRAMYLNHLGLRLGNRYTRIGAMEDLDEGIRIIRQAVEATPRDHPDRAMHLNNLGLHLSDRYTRTGTMVDLEEAIRITRQAVKAIPQDHLNRIRSLNSLGSHLGDRYSRTGAMADLEEFLHVARQAVEATPEDHPDRAMYLNNLGLGLGNRFTRTGAMVDLDEAIRIGRQAAEATPEDHPERAGWLNNLGSHLSNRCLRTGVMADLKEAICSIRKAIEATPDDHPNRAIYLNNLGESLGNRYSLTGVMTDFEEAIHVARQAIEATPEGHPRRAMYLNNLGSYFGNRYSRTDAMTDLEEAICSIRQAIEATPDDHPNRAIYLNNLGDSLGNRYSRTGAMADLEDSRISYTTALHSTGATTSTRVSAGRSLLSQPTILLAGLEAYHTAQTAVKLVSLSAPFSLQSVDKQHLLSQAVGLASDAAAVALHVRKSPLHAIKLLETGRGVIASSLQDIRTDLSSLEKEHPNLAKSFVDLRNLLDVPLSTGSVNTISPVTSLSAIADQRHQANSQMTDLLKNIRHQPGFETFLMAATEAQMQDAAAQGPIVIINVSRHRCDALIIKKVGLQALQLHQLTHEDILSKAGQLKSLETLSWLWTVVAKPVLDALGFTKTPPNDDSWPHVWWIPTGPLVRFPLHAAGNHLQGHSETVLDRVVSSYASSVKSIINTRQQPQKPTGNQDLQVVLVAMPKTPSQSVLHHATKEVDTVRGICTSIGVPYRQPQPYQKAVLDDLNSCRVFHFAGHGSTHPIDPLQSRLLLKDWQDNPLSVGNLLDKTNLRSTSPFLAYLSACGTGQILDDKSVDESIHLTSAFQLAGFRHVIGTLWEVDDALCVDMARMTYEFISGKQFSDGSVAYGLHHAMRTLRDQWVSKAECSGVKQKRDAVLITDTVQGTLTWVPYVHYGI